MDGSTALAVLGLEPSATKQQIKTTFRALAKGAHPDAFGAETTDAFVELREAYERALRDAPEAPSISVETSTAHAVAVAADSSLGADRRRSASAGSWFTSTRAVAGIDITDVAVAATNSLRSAMIVRPERVADPAEQVFASLLADEMASA